MCNVYYMIHKFPVFCPGAPVRNEQFALSQHWAGACDGCAVMGSGYKVPEINGTQNINQPARALNFSRVTTHSVPQF